MKQPTKKTHHISEKTRHCCLVISCLLLAATMFTGCSGNKDEEEKKPGKIQQMTDKAGAAAARQIQVPIERAEQVQGIEDQYTKQLQEAGQ